MVEPAPIYPPVSATRYRDAMFSKCVLDRVHVFVRFASQPGLNARLVSDRQVVSFVSVRGTILLPPAMTTILDGVRSSAIRKKTFAAQRRATWLGSVTVTLLASSSMFCFAARKPRTIGMLDPPSSVLNTGLVEKCASFPFSSPCWTAAGKFIYDLVYIAYQALVVGANDIYVVPGVVFCSAVRIYLPKDLRPRGNRDAVGKAILEVQRRFASGVPRLDPVQDMKIPLTADNSENGVTDHAVAKFRTLTLTGYGSLMKRIGRLQSKILKNPVHAASDRDEKHV